MKILTAIVTKNNDNNRYNYKNSDNSISSGNSSGVLAGGIGKE